MQKIKASSQSLVVTRSYYGLLALLLGARTLLGAPGLTTRSKDATRGSWHPTKNKKLLGAPGLTTRSKDATRGSWPDVRGSYHRLLCPANPTPEAAIAIRMEAIASRLEAITLSNKKLLGWRPLLLG